MIALGIIRARPGRHPRSMDKRRAPAEQPAGPRWLAPLSVALLLVALALLTLPGGPHLAADEVDADLGDNPAEPPRIRVSDGSANTLGPVTLTDPPLASGVRWRILVSDGLLTLAGDITAAPGTGAPRLLVLRAGR